MLTTTLCLEPSSLKSLFESSATVTVADEAPMGIVTDFWVLEDDGSALELSLMFKKTCDAWETSPVRDTRNTPVRLPDDATWSKRTSGRVDTNRAPCGAWNPVMIGVIFPVC